MAIIDKCICKSKDIYFIKKEKSWDIFECKSCGFVFVNPKPDKEFLKRHYQSYLPDSPDKIMQWKYMMSDVFKKSLAIISKYAKNKNSKLLDIGCAHGFFIEQARQKKWTNVSGIDLSSQAVQYAKNRGLQVEQIDLFEKKYNENEFDVITMFYVLEHVIDPVSYLKEVYRILKPNGLLLLRVPHTTPIVKILKIFNISNNLYDVPSHLSDFSPKTIKFFLNNTGYKDIKTFIGGMTYPSNWKERFVSCFFGKIAMLLEKITFGKYLLPGLSKTTIAFKSKDRS